MNNQELLDSLAGTEIAVVGMAGRFPGASNINQFWQNIRDGVESIRRHTDEELREAGVSEAQLRNPNYVKAGAPIDNMEQFDAGFFGFGPRDAAIMDPQHRHFLEVAWESLEHAGYDPSRFPGAIGVFGGSGHNAYLPYNLLTNPDLVNSVGFFLLRHTGNDKDFLTTRVSYLLDLTGPSVNVQTACSTSLVAIHMASQSLINGECDMALAGGVTFELPHRQGYLYHEGEILSPDGHCRAFDAESQGTVFGSGVGVVTLKRLSDAIEDGDTIHAVVLGSAINNDGSGKVNYLAPSVDGQASAIAEALDIAGLTADTISYVETHGTGTRLGDPIEISALTQAFRNTTDDNQFCAIGSTKTNIGHLDTAAGVAGFVKTVQALKHKQVPPSLNFKSPNPMIDFEDSPFYVNSKLQAWPEGEEARRAGISSLGVGGTNAHIVLEEPPVLEPSDAGTRPYELLTISGKTKSALDNNAQRLADFLHANPKVNLADVAYTLQLGRKPFEQRRVVAARNVAEAIEMLESGDKRRAFSQKTAAFNPNIIFMFPGGGAQYPNMGRDLYEQEPVYREAIDLCLGLLEGELDIDLKSLIFPTDEKLDEARELLKRPSYNLPAIFMTEYALAQLWQAEGVEPIALTGHSMGEYTAACLAGVLSVADALAIVTLRGKLFETLPEGGMISVSMPEVEVKPLLVEGADIAVINSPNLCVVSGEVAAIEQMEAILAEQDIDFRRVPINVAAHSAMLEPILQPFRERLQQVQFNAPQMPFISNVTGTWITAAEATSPDYWVRHLRHTVRFADGMSTLLEAPDRILLEVGPGQTLTSLVRQHPSKQASHTPIPSLRHRKEVASDVWFKWATLGKLWLGGFEVDWEALYDGERRHRIPLPTYAFDHQRYWIEPGSALFSQAGGDEIVLSKMANMDDWFYRPTWQKTAVTFANNSEPQTWLIFTDKLGLSENLANLLRQAGHTVFTVSEGDQFQQINDFDFKINPGARIDYETLIEELIEREISLQQIVHMWTINRENSTISRIRSYYNNQNYGFYSLLFLAQVLGDAGLEQELMLTVFSNGMQQVNGERVPRPEKATLLGPCRVIPREFPNMSCRVVDVMVPEQLEGDLAMQLLIELRAEPANETVAYRDGARWVQTFQRMPQPPAENALERLKQHGVYLITGGVGGIGLTMAQYLAKTVQGRLVLTSRSGLPPRGEWPAWLATNGENGRISRKILAVQAMEAQGAEILLVQADVTRQPDMQRVLQETKAKFGTINGIVHAAGVLDDNLIQLKEPNEADAVLAPKVPGTLLLDELLQEEAIDFMVLFSSTSSILGSAGQVDYVAANAFLNAFAHSKTADGTPTVAINWGVWQEVGMAAEAASGEDAAMAEGTAVSHPLLDKLIKDSEGEIAYLTEYATDKQWLLDEHRIKDGEALIPGTGYLEIAKAAVEKGVPNGAVEIRDIMFMAPLAVQGDEQKPVKVSLERSGQAFEFVVESKSGSVWEENVRGQVAKVAATTSTPPISLQAIIDRCTVEHVSFAPLEQFTQQEMLLDFGPRWKVLRDIYYGENEAIARLELADPFADDLQDFTLHPALMDLATTIGLPLLEEYGDNKDLYVPFSYTRLRALAPVPQKIFSHVRYLRGGSEMPRFEVTIYDEHGGAVVEIDEFIMKRVNHAEMVARQTAVSPTQAGGAEPQATMLQLALTDGILPDEGAEAFARVLANPAPQIMVTSLDLDGLLKQVEQEAMPEDVSVGLTLERPSLQNEYTAPSNPVEETLAKIWEELLGVDGVGTSDDFFELGGHSLIAVRLFNKIRKAYSVDFSLATLFEAPTIAEISELVVDELGESVLGEATSDQPAEQKRRKRKREWSPLVAIQPKGSKPPFFCVHGVFGNVLNLYRLTRGLGMDQPFFGLQAQGVDGKREGLKSAEAMADLYIKAMKTVQPEGPYYLGGYSLGGEIAFEMAQQLTRDGETVAILALLDTFEPGFARLREGKFVKMPASAKTGLEEVKQGYRQRQQAGQLVQPLRMNGDDKKTAVALNGAPKARQNGNGKSQGRLASFLASSNKQKIEAITKRIRNRVNTYRTMNQYKQGEQIVKSGETLTQPLLQQYLWGVHTEAMMTYIPQPYDGKITLFRASETRRFGEVIPEISWRALAKQGVELYTLEGTHEIIMEPWVSELTKLMQDALKRAQQEQLTAVASKI